MKQGDIQNIYHLPMPRWLFDDSRYMGLALEAKVVYTFLLNRFHLSRRNGWTNEDGCILIILVPNAFVYLFFTEYDSWVAREKIEYIELFYCQRNRIAIYIYPPAQRVNG